MEASDVYAMRMARVNITVPDELIARARAEGLNISRLAAAAIAEDLARRAKVAEMRAYLAELEAELGPVPDTELAEAVAWADGLPDAGARVQRVPASRSPRGPRSA